MIKVLFICYGNICRSPLAEFIFKDLVIKAGYTVAGVNATSDEADFDIASAATSREEIGNTIYPPSLKTLLAHGIGTPDNELGVSQKRARQITAADYDYYDLIIVMDQNNMRSMRRMFGDHAVNDGKVHMMLEYAGRPNDEVTDPWYTRGFDETWEDVFDGCKGLLAQLESPF